MRLKSQSGITRRSRVTWLEGELGESKQHRGAFETGRLLMDRIERERLGWVIASLAFAVLLALVIFSYRSLPESDRTGALMHNVAGNVGLPAAALASFVVLWSVFPPPREQS